MWRADVLPAVESVSSLPDREGHSQLREPIALGGGFGAAALMSLARSIPHPVSAMSPTRRVGLIAGDA